MDKMSFYHYAADCYNVNETYAEEMYLVEHMLQELKDEFLGCRCISQVIPVLDEAVKPEDRGISGLIVAPMQHFTIHTFSQRQVAFVDLFSQAASHPRAQESLQRIIGSKLGYGCKFAVCTDNTHSGFGMHRCLRLRGLSYYEAMALNIAIIGGIGMHPLSECISLVNNASGKYDIIQPIAESHIAIHSDSVETWLDVFSCRAFSETRLTRVIGDFGASILETGGFTRGERLRP